MQDIDRSDCQSWPAAVLANPAEWALFLDIDGTLIGMAPDARCRPGAARAWCSCSAGCAQRLGGAVALCTGRRIADADRLFAPLKLVASGVHGTELRRRRAATITMLRPPMPAERGAGDDRASAACARHPGRAEGARASAVHYRNAPGAGPRWSWSWRASWRAGRASSCGGAARCWRSAARAIPRERPDRLMQRPPFQGRRPVMIGDDHGDEPRCWRRSGWAGCGLRVAGEHFAPGKGRLRRRRQRARLAQGTGARWRRSRKAVRHGADGKTTAIGIARPAPLSRHADPGTPVRPSAFTTLLIEVSRLSRSRSHGYGGDGTARSCVRP